MILDVELFEEPKADKDKALDHFFKAMKRLAAERRIAALEAIIALDRLANNVLTGRSGQSYKVRALLWSLFNGKPTSLIEVLNLDWEIRRDLVKVILAFGYEDKHPDAPVQFFCNAMKLAIEHARQWEWFIEEGGTDV